MVETWLNHGGVVMESLESWLCHSGVRCSHGGIMIASWWSLGGDIVESWWNHGGVMMERYGVPVVMLW
jgi:hypothetical protein